MDRRSRVVLSPLHAASSVEDINVPAVGGYNTVFPDAVICRPHRQNAKMSVRKPSPMFGEIIFIFCGSLLYIEGTERSGPATAAEPRLPRKQGPTYEIFAIHPTAHGAVATRQGAGKAFSYDRLEDSQARGPSTRRMAKTAPKTVWGATGFPLRKPEWASDFLRFCGDQSGNTKELQGRH